MTKTTEPNNEGIGNMAKNMDDVGRLIQHAGAREAVPDERFERARTNVQAHWQQAVAQQAQEKRPARLRLVAIAASLAMAVGATFVFWNLAGTPGVISMASVDRVLGEVRIADQLATAGSAIAADTVITTGAEGRIALRMSGGQSLRIDADSSFILHSPNHVSLESGAIYIDTAFAENAEPILVSTPFGTAQDIGTQFQVRLTASMLVVGVRDGQVEVEQTGQPSLSIDKGYFVEMDLAGEPEKHLLESDDPDWEWIETIRPEFEIQDSSLEQYLRWYAHESGLTLDWADEASETNARTTILSGTISGSSLDESLLVVKQVAPFEHRILDNSFWVKVD